MSDVIRPEPGKSYKEYWGKNSINNRCIHVLSILEKEDQYTYKWWSKTNQRWMYDIRSISWFSDLYKTGYLQEKGSEINGSE